jgi:uncharacterized protein YodC (DUF2158 family)
MGVHEIQIADLVMLKAGGPEMIVANMGTDSALCMWFEGYRPWEKVFPLVVLRKIGRIRLRRALTDG